MLNYELACNNPENCELGDTNKNVIIALHAQTWCQLYIYMIYVQFE